jgi:hypothetical protein
VTLSDLLIKVSEKIKSEINCIKIGNIIAFYPDDKTADIKLYLTKQQKDGVLLKDTILPKVRVIMSDKLTLPILGGEDCLVVFNDFDITRWFLHGDGDNLPETSRKHDLADCFAIIGINGLYNKINYDNTAICLNYELTKINGDVEITGDTTQEGDTTQTGNVEVTGDVEVTGVITGTGGLEDMTAATSTIVVMDLATTTPKTLTITNGIVKIIA